MKLIIYVFICFSIVFLSGCYTTIQSRPQVVLKDDIFVSAASGNINVQVKVETLDVAIGKPSDGVPVVIQSSCTYSKYPCSIVNKIEIIVNTNKLFVPRSTYCDLSDINKVEVNAEENKATLTLYGGDASESYIVKIDFNSGGVLGRVLSSAMSPEQPLQETTYHVQILGN